MFSGSQAYKELVLSQSHSIENSRGSKGRYFWLIFAALCLALFLSALELTAVSTALPVIVHDLKGLQFSWVGTAYALASTAFLPMSGGIAEVLGMQTICFIY